MKVVEIQNAFGLENIRVAERPAPEPGPGQVLLRMQAASLNYRDLLMARGHYNPRQPLPLIPCSDGVGRVAGLGKGVTRLREGDRVCPIFSQSWLDGPPSAEHLRTTLGGPLDGTLAEYAAVSAEGVVTVPEHLTDAEAATLPCAGLTAWSALFTFGGLRPGETVLVLGSGGVSIFALQLARLAGARVIAVTGSPGKAGRLRSLGAEEVVDRGETPAWGKRVRELTRGRGADHVIEVGGTATLPHSLQAVRAGGTVSLIGVLSGVQPQLDLLPVLMHSIRLQGILVGHRAGFEAMNRAIAASGLRPVVDGVHPFLEARAGLERLARGAHLGKICLQIA